MTDTIFAVSSGAPPAAIAVLRVSGPQARAVAATLAGGVPVPRQATLRRLRDAQGQTLDRALVLWFPGPATATGEDLLELHLHGGRAVIAAVEQAVGGVTGTRRAQPGEFTRRALLAGRIDLAQAAGLADLLEAETEAQRRAALAMSEGAFSRDVRGWLGRLSDVWARLEAAIDYDEDGDVTAGFSEFGSDLATLADELVRASERPTSERVREGWRVVIAGPPNAGKSSLFNAMLDQDAAIVSPIAGTTRDRLEARVIRDGQLYTLVDTAGLAELTDDVIEREGIRRSRMAVDTADLVLWVDDEEPPPSSVPNVWLHGRADLPGRGRMGPWDGGVSARDPGSIEWLWDRVAQGLRSRLPVADQYLLHDHQRDAVARSAADVTAARMAVDPLVVAEHLRRASRSLSQLLGVDQVDAMLDALFSRFCLGK